MNYLRARVSHKAAVTFLEGLRKSTRFEVLTIGAHIEEAGFAIFREYADKDVSFTDCMRMCL